MFKPLCFWGLTVTIIALILPYLTSNHPLLQLVNLVELVTISGISFFFYHRYKLTNNLITDLSSKLAIVQDINNEAHQHFSSLIENIPCFITVISPQHDCLMVNNEITKITGIPKNSLLKEKCFKIFGNGSICPCCPAKKAFITKKVCQAIKTSHIINGKEFHIEITAIPVLNKAGTAAQYIIEITRDITEQLIAKEAKANFLKQTITALSKLIEKRDTNTNAHCIRVEKLAISIGKSMELSKELLDELSMAAILHDIGKIGIPEVVLNKPGKLTADEYSLIRNHPTIGYEALAAIEPFKHIAESILYHHEKFDGTGYPKHLTADQIPINSRIIAIADVWDALISDRPYRKAYPPTEAMQIMLTENNAHFDPAIFQYFLKVVANNP